MFRRPLVLLAALGCLLVLVPAALAARVHVRVEGKTTTLFGPTEPVVQAGTALEALEAASVLGELYYHVAVSGFGPYVDQVGRYPAGGSAGWVFKVDGLSPPVAADKVTLKDGDSVLWYYAEFGPTGGPPTLVLERRPKGCYAVLEQDDNGKKSFAAGAVLRVGRRSIRASAGRACLRRPHGLVRATLPGSIRSNALS